MIIHSVDECEQWVHYKAYAPSVTKQLFFEPMINGKLATREHILDIGKKCFQHNEIRIIENIEQIQQNYPNFDKVLNDLHIFMCPRPSASTANACANQHMVLYYARSTQIPWCMTDYITAHELGHTLQFRFCDKYDHKTLFKEYLTLRNAPRGMCEFLTDERDENGDWIYELKEDFIFMKGEYADRERLHGTWDTSPLEWFAEDFRYLFGTDKGDKYWGLPVEPPNEKIKDFILSLTKE